MQLSTQLPRACVVLLVAAACFPITSHADEASGNASAQPASAQPAPAQAVSARSSQDGSTAAAGPSGTTPERGFTSGSDIGDTFRETRKKRDARFATGVSRFAAQVEDRIYERTKLKFAASYTMVYQHAYDGSGPRDAFGADFDFIAGWMPVGREGCNHGGLEARFESRYKIDTPIAPSGLSTTIDSLWPTVSGFGQQDFALTQLYWKQDLLGDQLQLRLGKVSASAMFFGNRINSSNLFFLNFAFADGPSVFFPGNGLGLHARYRLDKCWTLLAGVQNANGIKTEIDPSTLKGEWWYAAQVEFTRAIRGLGYGTYRLGTWYVDPREGKSAAGAGAVLSIDQELSEKVVAFLRYGWQGGGLVSTVVKLQSLTGTEHALRVGVGVQGPIKPWPDDYAGIAMAWGKPSNSLARDSYVAEVFYRSQLTDTSHFTLSLQVIESSTIYDQVAVFGARYRFEF